MGAGGIVLPNHPPLVVAEQFGTLAPTSAACLGVGGALLLAGSPSDGEPRRAVPRAPGTDGATALALRHRRADPEAYTREVTELLGYLAPARPDQAVVAVPGAGARVPVWILGSSPFSAQLAAAFGLPYAFAAHFAPAHLMTCLALYHQHFRPSARLDGVLACSFVETARQVRRGLADFRQRTRADELMIVCSIYDHALRQRSLRETIDPT